MRRLGLISDIHGNAVALEAVLADIGRRRARSWPGMGPSERVQPKGGNRRGRAAPRLSSGAGAHGARALHPSLAGFLDLGAGRAGGFRGGAAPALGGRRAGAKHGARDRALHRHRWLDRKGSRTGRSAVGAVGRAPPRTRSPWRARNGTPSVHSRAEPVPNSRPSVCHKTRRSLPRKATAPGACDWTYHARARSLPSGPFSEKGGVSYGPSELTTRLESMGVRFPPLSCGTPTRAVPVQVPPLPSEPETATR
jgi:hypothetical protein